MLGLLPLDSGSHVDENDPARGQTLCDFGNPESSRPRFERMTLVIENEFRFGHAYWTATRRIAFWMSLIAGTLAISQAEGASCTHGFRFCDNCESQVIFYVKKNRPCSQAYRIANGAVFNQKLIKRPRGVYGTVNQTDGAYHPPADFVGEHHFEVRVDYERSGTRFKTLLKSPQRFQSEFAVGAADKF